MERMKLAVEEFTSPAPLQVEPHMTLDKVVALMDDEGIRHIPVVEDGVAIGIISDRDLALLSRHAHVDRVKVTEVMTPKPFHVTQDTPLDQVAFEMSRHKIGSAVVTDEQGKITGIFTVTDALNALIEILRGEFDDDPGLG